MSKEMYGTRATGHPTLRIKPWRRKDLVTPSTICLTCGKPFSDTAKHPVTNAE